MQKDTRLNWILQFLGLLWFLATGWGLWNLVALLRPDFLDQPPIALSVGLLFEVLLVIFITLIVHELVHGFFFWLFTHERPSFGMGPGYAYAAAPEWYFPKLPYLVVGLSPLVALTLFGLLLVPVIPATGLWVWLLAIVFNAGGAVGDLYICLRILREPADAWVRDSGDAFEIYRRGAE